MAEPFIVEESPSGRYRLEVVSVPTKPGCWSYTVGSVYRKGETEPFAVVKRNYSSFPFEFVEDHPNGHDYLVAGEDYQGQTVIELDTGARRDFLPPEAAQGNGFCWAEATYNREHNLLVACGCYWGGPYEYRLYDFSDPMNGWAEIDTKDAPYADDKAPVFNPDGTITYFETSTDWDAEEDAEGNLPYSVVATSTFARKGMSLELVSSWIDDEEKERREKQRLANEKWEKEWAEYKATDPLYVVFTERSEALHKQGYASTGADYVSIGQCYNGWHPTETFTDSSICNRILYRKQEKGFSLDLEWGRKYAPIKLIAYLDNDKVKEHWFEHSVEGMNQAFDKATEYKKLTLFHRFFLFLQGLL